MSATTAVKTAEIVIVEWKDLNIADDPSSSCTAKNSCSSTNAISQAIQKAYGRTGTGILAIRNVPGFVEAKTAFLPQAHTLATQLSQEYLEKELTDVTSLYNAGWSHGKEKLGNNSKQPDYAKASFYYNPVTDTPGSAADRATYPCSYPCNVWPEKIPGFKEKAVTMGLILKEAAVAVARHVDNLASELSSSPHEESSSYPPHLLYNLLKDTDKVKARLLYYYPLALSAGDNENEKETAAAAEDSWIGWHNDSGFLTALAGDLYVNHTTGEPVVDSSPPDPQAGLYVVDRWRRADGAAILKVELPPDCCAVQIGECTEIVTGGAVQATPHCVRGIRSTGNNNANNIARISLPCFVDTPPTFVLQSHAASRETVLAASCNCGKVPELAARWRGNDMTFGEFLQKTFEMYYEWNTATNNNSKDNESNDNNNE